MPLSQTEPVVASPAKRATAKPRVVYVMGAGRSGSTVLGVVLGNCADVFYAGELDAWLRKKGVSNFDGRAREEFWRDVAAEVPDGAGLFGEEARRYVEHSSAVFRRPRPRRAFRRRYREVAGSLYRAISRRSDSTYVVDTSHYPLRARELQRLEGIELYLLYLVREPRSVVSSFSKQDVDQPSQSPFKANLYLHLTNLLASLVFLRQPRERRLLLRYEDFMRRPEESLAEVLDWLGAGSSLPDLTALQTGLAFQGNRLLRSDSIALKRDGWEAEGSRPLTTLAQAPWTLLQRVLRSASAKRT